jgi:hypothetical protein
MHPGAGRGIYQGTARTKERREMGRILTINDPNTVIESVAMENVNAWMETLRKVRIQWAEAEKFRAARVRNTGSERTTGLNHLKQMMLKVGSLRAGAVMKKFFQCIGGAVRKCVHRCMEASRQADTGNEGYGRYDYGFHELRENQTGPPLFYTETCPEGTYLIGVIEAGAIGGAEEDEDTVKASKRVDDTIISEDNGSIGPWTIGQP